MIHSAKVTAVTTSAPTWTRWDWTGTRWIWRSTPTASSVCRISLSDGTKMTKACFFFFKLKRGRGRFIYVNWCRQMLSKNTTNKILFLSYILYTQMYNTVQDDATFFRIQQEWRNSWTDGKTELVFLFLMSVFCVRHIHAKPSKMSINTICL